MSGEYREFYFTTNATNNVCPGFPGFQCRPPNACVKDAVTGQVYCCDAGSDKVCWGITSTCLTDGSTFQCGSGKDTWCCLFGREECTRSNGQINICWAKGKNPIEDIAVVALQSAHSSLSREMPAATELYFDPAAMIALTRTTSSQSTTTTKTGSSTLSTTPPPGSGGPSDGAQTSGTHNPASATSSGTSQGARQGSDSSASPLNAGAVAGIAIGSAAIMAIIVAAVLVIWWRRKKRQEQLWGVSSSSGFGSQWGRGRGAMAHVPSPTSMVGPRAPHMFVTSSTPGRDGTRIEQNALGAYQHAQLQQQHSLPPRQPNGNGFVPYTTTVEHYGNPNALQTDSPPYTQNPPYDPTSNPFAGGTKDWTLSELPAGGNPTWAASELDTKQAITH